MAGLVPAIHVFLLPASPVWIPAFAGMTGSVERQAFRGSRPAPAPELCYASIMEPAESVLFFFGLFAMVAEAMTAALAAGRRKMDWFGVAMLGCITALGGGSLRDVLLGHYPLLWVKYPSLLFLTGGVLRDILCTEVPLLFRSELYASVSLMTGAIYVAGTHFGTEHVAVVIGSVAFGLTFRLLAIRYKWEMPKFIYEREGPH